MTDDPPSTPKPGTPAAPDSEPPDSGVKERSPGVSRDTIAEFVCRPEVRKQLFGRVYQAIKDKYRRQEAEDFVDDISLACMVSRTPPANEAALLGWVHGVATHVLADLNRVKMRRGNVVKFVRNVPDAAEPWRENEVELEKWMITPWAKGAVVGDPHAAETLWIICDKARSGKTWAEIAKARGETEDQVKKRVQRFGESYGPARRKYLIQIGLILACFLLALLAFAYVWFVLPRTQAPAHATPPHSVAPIAPVVPAPPSANAPPTARPEVFEPAAGPAGTPPRAVVPDKPLAPGAAGAK